ncbi:hypothetical protein PRIPAC_97053 [Pristionchus pacificus]|nr:hypothetical protein PRIPAC_97053 [Pristionchus pacificus]
MPGPYQVKVRWNKRAATLVPSHSAKRPKRALPDWANPAKRRTKRVEASIRDAQNEEEMIIDAAEVSRRELQKPSLENGQFPSHVLTKIFNYLPINNDGIRCPFPDTVRVVCQHWNTIVRENYRNTALEQRTKIRHILISQMADGFVTHAAMTMDANLTPESSLSEIRWFGIEPNFEVKYAYHDSVLRNDPSELISPVGRTWLSKIMEKMNGQLPSTGSPSDCVRNDMFTYLKKFLSYYLPDEIILDEVDLTEAFVKQLKDILSINKVKGVKINFKSSGVYRRRRSRNVINSCTRGSLLELLKISRHVEDIDQRLIDSTFVDNFVSEKKDNDFNAITVTCGKVVQAVDVSAWDKLDHFFGVRCSAPLLEILAAAQRYRRKNPNQIERRGILGILCSWVLRLSDEPQDLIRLLAGGPPDGWTIDAPFQVAREVQEFSSSINDDTTVQMRRYPEGYYIVIVVL